MPSSPKYFDRPGAEQWQPWRPLIGMHVRVMLNGECSHIYRFAGGQSADDPSWKAGTGHRFELEHGRLGTITNNPGWSEDHNGHIYMVQFDHALPLPWYGFGQIEGQMYAAAELEEMRRDPLTGLWVPVPSDLAAKYER